MEKYLILFIFLYSCANYNIEKHHPIFIDKERQHGRIYNTKRIEPKPQCGQRSYEFKYSGENIPLSEMNGYICFKRKEVTDALADYDEYEREQCEKMKEVQNKTR